MNIDGVALNLVETFGPLGFIFWLVYRVTTQIIPRIVSDFKESIAQQRADFRDQANKQIETFERMLQREQDFNQERIRELIESVQELTKEIRDERRAEVG